jgi:hypothetical protein
LTKLKGENGIYKEIAIDAFADYEAINALGGHVSTRIEWAPHRNLGRRTSHCQRKHPSSMRALEPSDSKTKSSSTLNALEMVTAERLIPRKIWCLILFISNLR